MGNVEVLEFLRLDVEDPFQVTARLFFTSLRGVDEDVSIAGANRVGDRDLPVEEMEVRAAKRYASFVGRAAEYGSAS